MGARHGQWIDIQNHILPLWSKPPATPHMQDDLFVSHWKIIDDCLLGISIGAKILHLPGAVVSLIHVHVQGPGIQDFLPALSGIKSSGLYPDHIEEVQHSFRQEETQIVLVELELSGFFIHIVSC